MNIVEYVRQFPRRPFCKGELLMSEGDVTDTVLAISQGYVKVTALDSIGNERLLWIAGRYDIIPTERFFSPLQPLRFFYTALSDGTAYALPKQELLARAKTDLGMMTEIATSMSAHYDDLLGRLYSIEKATVREKLLSTLHYIAARFSADDTVDLYQLGLRLTHQDLADMIGSTRETTSLELQRLRRDGAISYDYRQFTVTSPQASARTTDTSPI